MKQEFLAFVKEDLDMAADGALEPALSTTIKDKCTALKTARGVRSHASTCHSLMPAMCRLASLAEGRERRGRRGGRDRGREGPQ